MRRALLTITLALVVAVPLAACGSSNETNTSSSSTTTTTAKGGSTKTTTKPAVKLDPKCRALAAWALADYAASNAGSKPQAEKDALSAKLDKAAPDATKEFPQISTQITARQAYLHKLLTGQNIPQNEKDAAEKARTDINQVRTSDCKPGMKGATTTTAPGGAPTTTAAGAPTTTAKK